LPIKNNFISIVCHGSFSSTYTKYYLLIAGEGPALKDLQGTVKKLGIED